MTMYETVYLGHDNVIKLVLTADGETVSIVNTTRATASFGTTLIDSDTSLSVFDWSEGEEGLLHLTFGEESIPVGSYKVVLTLYDSVNTDGIVWDDFRCRVVGEDLSPVPPTDPPILISQGGTGQSTAHAAFNALKQIATETYTGVTELATTAECITGTDTLRVVTPAGLTARIDDLMETRFTPAHTYYVSASFTVDEDSHRFDTIQGAIDYAIVNMPPDPQAVKIAVTSGIYPEQITDTHSRIFIQGAVFTSAETKSVIIQMSGVGSANYPIGYTGSETLNLANLTVKVDSGGVYGEFLNLVADRTSFLDGHFVEYLGSGFRKMEFRFSQLTGDGFDLTGDTDGRVVTMLLSGITGSPSFGSTSGTGPMLLMMMIGSCSADLLVKGDWSLDSFSLLFIENYSLTFDTTGGVKIKDSKMPNGMHFTSDPNGEIIIGNNDFLNRSIASDHEDISADVTITDVNYSGNIQQNGICGCIQIKNPEKHVGKHIDQYFDLQSAITSVPSGETATVRIWEDLTNLPEITLPNANTNIKIKGQKSYSLSFTGDIVEIGNDRILGFNDIVTLSGGNIELNGTSNELGLESCQYVNAYVTITAGTFAILYKSSLFGSTGHKAIYINNTDTIVVVGYSRVQGATGQPAVEFNANADTKFKAKYSTFIHGDKSTTCPLSQTVGGSINIAVYLCGVNKIWSSPNPFLNVIAKPGNTDDTEINF